MTLQEYLVSTDVHAWWRMDSGDHLNLFDAALEELETVTAQRDKLLYALVELQAVSGACGTFDALRNCEANCRANTAIAEVTLEMKQAKGGR